MTTRREAKIALTSTWDDCRPMILSSIAKELAERMPGRWVSVTSVLPAGVPTRSWRTLWKNAMEVGVRSTEYVPVEGYYLLRHKFSNNYFVWCLPRDDFSGELDSLVDRAMRTSPNGSVPGITELQDIIDDKCAEYVNKLNHARECIERIENKTHSPRKRSSLPVEARDDNAIATKRRKSQTTNGILAEIQERRANDIVEASC